MDKCSAWRLEVLGIGKCNNGNIKKNEKANLQKTDKTKNRKNRFEKLETLKKSHSKVQKIEHNRLVMQKYLQPNTTKLSTEEVKVQNNKC